MSTRNQRKSGRVLDTARLREISNYDLQRRIDTLKPVVAGNSKFDQRMFDEAIAELHGNERTITDYKKAYKQLKQEARRRNRELREGPFTDVPWTPYERFTPDLDSQLNSPEALARFQSIADVTGRTMEDVRLVYESLRNDEHYRNSRYYVALRREQVGDGMGGALEMVHLSVKRHDQKAVRDWRDMQRTKNELLGEEVEAIELYPAESRCVDTANQYHMWAVNSTEYRWPVGWNEGRVKTEQEDGMTGQRNFEA